MSKNNTIEALKRQRKEITERSSKSIDPYLATLTAALHDEEVFDFLIEKMETHTIDEVILRQTEPIAILEFELSPRDGVKLTNQHFLVGMLPESKRVSLDVEELLNSKEGQAAMLPLGAYIESRATVGEIAAEVSDRSLIEKEDRFRARIGVPSLSDIVDRFRGLGYGQTQPPLGGLEWGEFFDIESGGSLWGSVGAASPSSGYTKCISETNGGKDGYYVTDDCG